MIDKLITTAEKYVGYLEKKTNSKLDDFIENAGMGNYTCFARDFKKYSGINAQGQPWCDVFVDWCFIESYGGDMAKELLHGFSAYTPTSANYFKKYKQWYTEPMIGDVIFFKNSTRICHTGIVYKVSDDRVYTIEGNTSGGTELIPNGGEVAKKSYKKSYARIAGYGRPDYSIIKEDIDMEELNALKKQIEELNAHINAQNARISTLEGNQRIVYHYGTQVPEWGRVALFKAQQKGVFTGASADDLNISDDSLKTIVFMDRCGLFD